MIIDAVADDQRHREQVVKMQRRPQKMQRRAEQDHDSDSGRTPPETAAADGSEQGQSATASTDSEVMRRRSRRKSVRSYS